MQQIDEIQSYLFQQARSSPHRPLRDIGRLIADWTVLATAFRIVAGGMTHDHSPRATLLAQLKTDENELRDFLHELGLTITSGRYRPGPVRRYEVPKRCSPDKTRTVVSLDLKDRIVHTAVKLILEPIVEAMLDRRSFGFRAGRGRFDELAAVRSLVQQSSGGFSAALTADVKDCFDSVDHRSLMGQLHHRVADPHIDALLATILQQVGCGRRGWLCSRPVGLIQGSPLSPLLANLALSPFDRQWRQEYGQKMPMLRYADDLIVLAPTERDAAAAQKQLASLLRITTCMKLAAAKTQVTTFTAGVSLLGMKLMLQSNRFTSQQSLEILCDPSQIGRILDQIEVWGESITPDTALGVRFRELNQKLRGWFESYQYAYDAPQAFEAIDCRVLRVARGRLKTVLKATNRELESFLEILPSGHQTMRADNTSILVLGSLPRRRHRSSTTPLPWEGAERTARGLRMSPPKSDAPHTANSGIPSKETGTSSSHQNGINP